MSTALPTLPTALDNPWPGLAPYTEQQHSQFFGRETETEELLRLIQRETLTVLFGRSGSGKSSLLNAGVLPRLRSGMFFPVMLRLNFADPAVDPVEQVKAITLATAREGELDVESRVIESAAPTLWDFFHHTDFWGPRNDRLTPLLIFDQFEEAFTIGKDQKQASGFLEQLADLAENRVPLVLEQQIRQSAQRITLDAGNPTYKIVLSLREDFVSRLDQLRPILPAIMRNRMALLPLDGERALQVIENAGQPWVSERVAGDIVAALAGETGTSTGDPSHAEIEPAYLSVMCHELFLRMVELGHDRITSELVARERGEILEAMYERSFEGLAEPVRMFVEDRLLTASGFRGTLPLSEAVAEGVSLADLESLVDRRLLRFEDRLGTRHIELSHDLLTGVVKKSRELRAARVARERSEHEREELRRAFRSKVITVLAAATVAIVVLGALSIWALVEGHKAKLATDAANQANKDLQATNAALKEEEIELLQQTQEANNQKNIAQAEEHKADLSNSEMQVNQKKTRELSDTIMHSSESAISATYQDALKEIDAFQNTTDQNAKDQLDSSIRTHQNNLQKELASVDAILNMESTDKSAKSLKLSLLFYIADLQTRAYGFDGEKYQTFIGFAQPMVDDKDPWLQAKALRAVAQAAGIILRKPDPVTANALLYSVRLKSMALESTDAPGGLSAETWDALEDTYEECADLQKDRNPQDAEAWFNQAMQAETKAAQLNPSHVGDVARIAGIFGEFEKDQKDYEAAIYEYSTAIQATQQKLHAQNGDNPDSNLVTCLIDRGDAEVAAQHNDTARHDFEEASADAGKLGDSSEILYKKLVLAERLGDLEEKAKNPSQALTWYKQEKQIALDLAHADSHYRSSVINPYTKTSNTMLEMGDIKGARAELDEEVSAWDGWAAGSPNESDLVGYTKTLLALGNFDYGQKNYNNALQSYDEAYSESLILTVRRVAPANENLLVQSRDRAALADVQLKDFDKALQIDNDVKHWAQSLIGEDCETYLDEFGYVENRGIIASLAALKRPGDAKDEARKAMQLVDKSCASINKSSSQKARETVARFWGNLSWAALRAGDTQTGEACAEKGLALDPSQRWIEVNLAHSYLLSGRVGDAQHLYGEIKDVQWDGRFLKVDIRNDFAELRDLGLGQPAMQGILNSLDEHN